jgi:ubiquitin-like protein Pup
MPGRPRRPRRPPSSRTMDDIGRDRLVLEENAEEFVKSYVQKGGE